MKTKILWLCNSRFSENKIKFTGSWLQPLAIHLQCTGKVDIINLCTSNVPYVVCENIYSIKQYIIPRRKYKKYGHVPDKLSINDVMNIINIESPDIIHIWGTESIWGYFNIILQNRFKTLIDIQGLLNPYSIYYYGGLGNKEIIKSIGLKEIVMPTRTLFYKKRVFEKRGQIENFILKSFKNISVQSNWVKNYIGYNFPNAMIYKTKIVLRDGFYKARKWEYKEVISNPIIFSSCAAAVPYKGMHILIKTVAILKKKYSDIQLRLAGIIKVGDKLLDGYSKYIITLISKLGLENNVVFLGSIDEDKIIEELQNCNVCVIPSFVETYCLAFAEAMIVGTPTVVSYSSALPQFAKDNEEALFYNSNDYYSAASCIQGLIEDRTLAEKISINARNRRLIENNISDVINTQLRIYNIINNQ